MILFSQKKKEKIYRDREEIQVLLRSVFFGQHFLLLDIDIIMKSD
jgi:hypothetical protein